MNLIDILFLPMSLSLSLSHIIHLFLLIRKYVVNFPLVSTFLHHQLTLPYLGMLLQNHFQVYSCCPWLIDISVQDPILLDNGVVEAISDPSSTISPMLDLVTSENDQLNVTQKLMCSICYSSLCYSNLSYHRLSTIHCTYLSSLSFVLISRSR